MRESCINCTRKHLACAEILMKEYADGYLGHDWLAMGHLAQAEEEIVKISPQRSMDIRNYRKLYEEDRNYQIPVLDLINAITEEFEINQQNIKISDLPHSSKCGVDYRGCAPDCPRYLAEKKEKENESETSKQ